MRMRHKTVGKEGENLREAFSVRVPEDVFSPHRMLCTWYYSSFVFFAVDGSPKINECAMNELS